MSARFDRALPVLLRRQLYLLLLVAGFVGLLGLLVADVRPYVARGAVATSAPAAGQTITGGSVMDGFGAWSPDGRQIAFMRNGQIWLMGARGEGPRQLTGAAGAWDAAPAWRPDGKAIGFARMDMEAGAGQLMVVEPASGKTQTLGREAAPVGHVAWGPAGTGLYYTTSHRLMRIEASSGKALTLLEVKGDWELMAGGLAISPDGKVAVIGAGPTAGRGVQYDLWLLPLGGGTAQEAKRLTTGGGIMPSFAPSGRKLAYRNPRAEQGIYVMDLQTHATRLALADEGKALFFHPAFSPDGKRLLLSRLMLDGGLTPQGKLTSHLFVHTLTGAAGD